jgi:hypothetical protein
MIVVAMPGWQVPSVCAWTSVLRSSVFLLGLWQVQSLKEDVLQTVRPGDMPGLQRRGIPRPLGPTSTRVGRCQNSWRQDCE